MQQSIDTGIASFGLHLPPLAMAVEELAALRGVDPQKYTRGLGLKEMALCPKDFGVCELATEAARRAIARWDGDLSDIGLVAVGTETAVDMSRPLSAFVSQGLGLSGAIRSYEVKHACYGGTLALKQAVEWRASGAARGKAALVVAADVALYAERDPGEPTQGAGAVAMIIADPEIARIDPVSHAYSEPVFDFWRPVGEAYPLVDGPLSLDCYKRGAFECFSQLVGERDAQEVLEDFVALCFHVPFPKMVKKAFFHLGESWGWDEATTTRLFETKVAPSFKTNQATGNAYTASLWLSVASTLAGQEQGAKVGAFSYGSGFGAELTALEAGPAAHAAAWMEDLEQDLAGRTLIDKDTYAALRAEAIPAH